MDGMLGILSSHNGRIERIELDWHRFKKVPSAKQIAQDMRTIDKEKIEALSLIANGQHVIPIMPQRISAN